MAFRVRDVRQPDSRYGPSSLGSRESNERKMVFRAQRGDWQPAPLSLRGHPVAYPKPAALSLRRAVSFVDRDAEPGQSRGPFRSLVVPGEAVPAWPEPRHADKADKAKMSRSKSFLEPASGVRKMIKKSASILYPSWLAVSKRTGNKRQQQQMPPTARVTTQPGAWEPANPFDDGAHNQPAGRWSPTPADHPEAPCGSPSGSPRTVATGASGKKSNLKKPFARHGPATDCRTERRWQSLIALPETDDARGGRRQGPASVYGGRLLELECATSGEDLAGSARIQPLVRPRPTKAQSQSSLVSLGPQSMPSGRPQRHSLANDADDERLVSCPSYESLDDYLLTSDDSGSRRWDERHASLPPVGSFESLARPPPPADAHYSPPDISPDDSSETQRGSGRGRPVRRNKLQRLPTFIQRQEAWHAVVNKRRQLRHAEPGSWASSGSTPEPDEEAVGERRAVYWHDWLPPPAALLDCGCGLCRVTASMSAGPPPAPQRWAPKPPTKPPPPVAGLLRPWRHVSAPPPGTARRDWTARSGNVRGDRSPFNSITRVTGVKRVTRGLSSPPPLGLRLSRRGCAPGSFDSFVRRLFSHVERVFARGIGLSVSGRVLGVFGERSRRKARATLFWYFSFFLVFFFFRVESLM